MCLNLCVGLVNERAKVPKLIIGRVPALLLVPFVAGIAAGVPADGVLGRVAGAFQGFQLNKSFAKNFRHRLADEPVRIKIRHR